MRRKASVLHFLPLGETYEMFHILNLPDLLNIKHVYLKIESSSLIY